MFLNFQKLANQPGRVIVNSDSIMILETDTIIVNGSPRSATRVEIAGYSRMGFYTSSTFDQITAIIPTIDVRTGYDPSACGAVLVYSSLSYPLIKTNMIFNSTLDELEAYAFNPVYLISAEETVFTDVKTHQQETGLVIALHDVNPRRILTDLTYNQLKAILQVVDVPTS